MRTALPRYCLSALLALPALSSASLGYSVKTQDAPVFRTEALEPPPLGTLESGLSVRLIHRGPSGSLIETEGGLKGWMRNADLLAMAAARPGEHRLGAQKVVSGGEPAISPNTQHQNFGIEVSLEPDRTFSGEILEAMDREQVEMRHDEN